MNEELEHGLLSTVKNFVPKYYKRIEENNGKSKYRYFYSAEEYQSYLKSKTNTTKKQSILDVTSKMISNGTSKAKEALKKADDLTKGEASKKLKSTVSKTKENVTKKIEEKTNGKVGESEISKAVSTGKKLLEKYTGKSSSSKASVSGTTTNSVFDETDEEFENRYKQAQANTAKVRNFLNAWTAGAKAAAKITKSAVSVQKKLNEICQHKATSPAEAAAQFAVHTLNQLSLPGIMMNNVNAAKRIIDTVQDMPRNKLTAGIQDLMATINKTTSQMSSVQIDEGESIPSSGKEEGDAFSKIPEADPTYNCDRNMAAVNPDFDASDYGTSNNCSYCTATYELRERGYDVTAAEADPTDPITIDEISEWYGKTEDDWQYIDLSKSKSIEYSQKAVKDALDYTTCNSRGQFIVYWSFGGGHSMVYENRGGEVIVRDTQSNTTYTSEEFVEYFAPYIAETATLRTDNATLNESILKCVKQ